MFSGQGAKSQKNYGQLYSLTEEATHNRSHQHRQRPQQEQQFNIGHVDDADLLQHEEEDSDDQGEEVNSEGDMDDYPRKQRGTYSPPPQYQPAYSKNKQLHGIIESNETQQQSVTSAMG